MKKRALISVFDKNGIVELCQFLVNNDYEIVSTGGTLKHLNTNGVEAIDISEVTQFPEMLDGRVKTLHPFVHGGILAKRSSDIHMKTIQDHGIQTIDMVVVNLYPFFEESGKGHSENKMIEFIDIGGPTMLRSAAKAFEDVLVVSDVNDYTELQEKISSNSVDREFRKKLAGKVFNLTSAYDAAISNFLLEEEFPNYLALPFQKSAELRYGENPHQNAAFYTSITEEGSMKDYIQLGGKALSFNNIRDMDVAWKIVSEFKEDTACCALKHSTPCGVAMANTVSVAYQNAHDADPISIFGGIVAFNKKVDTATAENLIKIFLEIVVAPEFDEEAIAILHKKKNLRIIKINTPLQDTHEVVKVDGGVLIQNTDNQFSTDIKAVTEKQPSDQQLEDLIFAQKIVKHAKSNAIVVAKDGVTLGIGTGQVNRIWAAEHALANATENCVLASDAFFPFSDVVEAAAKAGVVAIIQPGGSMRDQDSIDKCNELQIPMVFTSMRHFKH